MSESLIAAVVEAAAANGGGGSGSSAASPSPAIERCEWCDEEDPENSGCTEEGCGYGRA